MRMKWSNKIVLISAKSIFLTYAHSSLNKYNLLC